MNLKKKLLFDKRPFTITGDWGIIEFEFEPATPLASPTIVLIAAVSPLGLDNEEGADDEDVDEEASAHNKF